MKKLFCLTLIIACASHFGTNPVFAQKKRQSKQVIIVEILIPDFNSVEKLEFPINKTLKGKLKGGGGMVSECASGAPECKNAPYSSYDFSGKAFAAGKNLAKINLKGDITANDKDCEKINRTLTVYRHRKMRVKLDCGVSLIAYYGVKSKRTN